VARTWNVGGIALSVLLLGLSYRYIAITPYQLLEGQIGHDAALAKWREALRKGEKPIWILTTLDQFRPNSVESGLCKGRWNMDGSGSSDYLTRLFPNFRCATTVKQIDDASRRSIRVGSVGFVRLPTETLDESIERVERYYSISLGQHGCEEVVGPFSVLVYCLSESQRG
jgi:hypothetical protein